MVAQDQIRRGVAEAVALDAVNVSPPHVPLPVRRCGHLLGLDELEIELDRRGHLTVDGQDTEGLAIRGPRHPHGPQLGGQLDLRGPVGKERLQVAIGLLIVAEYLQAWPRAHAIVGQRCDDFAGVAVVGHLVAGAIA